jgi:hypothetical protein
VVAIHQRFTYRMHDLAEFMKGLLQRFTQWFNRAHSRSGTLWEDRFKSVIVEDGVAASPHFSHFKEQRNSLPGVALAKTGVRRCPCIDNEKAILADHRHFTGIGDHASPLLVSSHRGEI